MTSRGGKREQEDGGTEGKLDLGGKWNGWWWWELWTQRGWIEFAWPNILTIGGQRVFPRLPSPERERGGSSLAPITQTDDHAGSATLSLTASSHPVGEPLVAHKLQLLLGRQARFVLSPGRCERARRARNFKSWRLAPRFTRNNDCGHVTSNSLLTNHVVPLHLIPSLASPQRRLWPPKPHIQHGLPHQQEGRRTA